jgi:iron complex transport system substrate-binding protein
MLLTACSTAATPTAQIVPVTVTPPEEAETLPPQQEVEQVQITIQDALGRTVTLDKAPERIVLAGKAVIMVTDAVYAFPGAGSKIVGISNTNQGRGDFISLLDPNYAAKVTLANDVGPEQVAALQPDLVIMKSFLAESLGGPLETLGIPVVYLNLETPEQYRTDLTTLGQVFQNEARAQELIDYYDETVTKVASATAGMDDAEKPRVLLLYYSEKDGNVAFNVPPKGYIQTFLVETAGGIPVWLDIELGSGWTKVGLEQIAAWDPDQVYVVSYSKNAELVVDDLKSDPNWQGLKAVTGEQIFAFPADFYSWDQPDVRWALGLQWLAAKVHPALWQDFDTLQSSMGFFEKLYGIDTTMFIELISPLMTGIQ